MPGQKNNSGGKKGRSGRKSKAEELGLQALLDKCWTKAEREECIRSLAATAKDPNAVGRMEAVKLLMGYTFGTPKATVDLNHAGSIEVEYVNDWRGGEG